MKSDIVFPSGNEEELIKAAEELGFEELVLVYSDLGKAKNISDSKIKIYSAVLVGERNKGSLVKKVNKIKNKGFLVLLEARDDSFNRFVLEKTRADMVFNLEKQKRKDATHYRRSGLDQVLCKATFEKKKKIIFLLENLEDPLLLGRVIQNIKFCRKYKVDFEIVSWARNQEGMRAASDLKALVRTLQQKFL